MRPIGAEGLASPRATASAIDGRVEAGQGAESVPPHQDGGEAQAEGDDPQADAAQAMRPSWVWAATSAPNWTVPVATLVVIPLTRVTSARQGPTGRLLCGAKLIFPGWPGARVTIC